MENRNNHEGWFGRLLRKRVIQTLALYIAIAWGGTEIVLAVQDTLGFPEWVARLVMALFIAGIPVAVFLAWAHDLKSRWARLSLRGVSAGILVVGAILVFQQSRSPGPPEDSLAVLPFVDMSPDTGQRWLVDALSEDLRNVMAQSQGLLVIAAASSEIFRGRAQDLDQIRDELSVRHILEGSVRHNGDMLTVTANLIDTVTRRHLWSDRYELPAENLFDIEEQIVERISGALRVTLAPEIAEGGTRNLAAYEAFQRGMSSDDPGARLWHLEEAIAIDPGFAWPLISMAGDYALQAENAFISPQEAQEKALPFLRKAEDINERIPEIHFVHGLLHTYLGEFAAAENRYKRTIELNPNFAPAYGAYGLILRWGMNQPEKAVILHERNVLVDPLDYTANLQLGTSYWAVGRLDETQSQYEKAIRICPVCGMAYQSYSGFLGEELGRVDKALEIRYRMFDKLRTPPNPRQVAGTAMGHEELGDRETANKLMNVVEKIAPDSPFLLVWKAERAMLAGQYEEARELYRAGHPGIPQANSRESFLVRLDVLEGHYDRALERYRKAASGLFENPVRLDDWSEDMSPLLFRTLVAVGETVLLERLLTSLGRAQEADEYHLLYDGRISQAVELIRQDGADGFVRPHRCVELQEEIVWLPDIVDSESAELQQVIKDACAERERQLAFVLDKIRSGEFQVPE